METTLEKNIFRDYTEKIKRKLPENTSLKESDVNEFIALLNYCFLKKNNFFIENFNLNVIKNVYLSYNQIKTNILTPTITDLLFSITNDNIKLLRFILINYVNNYDTIMIDNKELCEIVSKDGIKHCHQYFCSVLKK